MELVILVGLQASGKSTYCRQALAASHTVVSKDDFGNARHRQRRQLRLINDLLTDGRDVVVDNTNPSPDDWQPLITVERELPMKDAYRDLVERLAA
ncbi:AAA domain-containing protein [Asanoa ferruginea]|uniref:AAA domain-containing protein n=1 Tax=Asanoa ferruginea TaxID=53367 RepID=A0A3D9ZVH9_9ACTN|nr:AAA family ATPase [Asanoa ferruginea]REG00523.1 AAA domain-containing protein [Asanoa ferruginea]